MKKNNKLSKEQILKIAKLADLKLKPQQVKNFSRHLTSMLDYVSKIQALDTENVPETNQVTGLINIFRNDVIDRSRMLSQKEALSNAKRKYKGYFVVSSIF